MAKHHRLFAARAHLPDLSGESAKVHARLILACTGEDGRCPA